MPNLDSNINDLQSMVDKLSKELDKETKKREHAVRDKDQSVEKLRVYETIYEALNIADPKQFMQDFDTMRTDVENLSQKMAE